VNQICHIANDFAWMIIQFWCRKTTPLDVPLIKLDEGNQAVV
jgi:hypothetical protein